MAWSVVLKGDSDDLSALAKSFCETELAISSVGDRYELTSSKFESLGDAIAIRDLARELVDLVNGGSRLQLGMTTMIQVGPVYWRGENGELSATAFVEPLECHVRVGNRSFISTDIEGNVTEHHPGDPIKKWIECAKKDSAVADALEFLSLGTDWYNLYKLLEIVQQDLGGAKNAQCVLSAKGWATKSEVNRFTNSVNNRNAIGREARHAGTANEPPRKPMTHTEASRLVKTILRKWLDFKADCD